MTEPFIEQKPQPWRCDFCGAVNDPTGYKRCAGCGSPAPVVRERQSTTRRTLLLGGLVTGAVFLCGGGFWAASSPLPRQQSWQEMWEVLLDPGSTLSGSGDFVAPAIAWSPDGTKIACTARLGKPINTGVMVVDAKTAQTTWTHQEAQIWFYAIAWSPDGRQLALAGSSSPSPFIQIWQVQGWQKVTQYPLVKSGACGHLVWSPDGTRLAGFTRSDSQEAPSVQIWKASDGEVLFRQEAGGQDLFLSWLPDSYALATSWQQGGLDIWDTRTGKNRFHCEPDVPSASRGTVQLFLSGPDAALSPDGRRAALYTVEQGQLVIQVWDLGTASPLFSCQPVPGQHWCLTWSPDGNYLAECQSNSSPTSIRFWEAESGKLALSYDPPSGAHQLTWSPNGRFLAVVTHHGPSIGRAVSNIVLQIWEVQ